MTGRSRWQRSHTPDSRASGAREKSISALTTAAGAVRDTAIETAKEGITKIGEQAGKLAGAGLAVAATSAVGAFGYHASPLVTAGAAIAGVKVGGLVAKAMTAGFDKVVRPGGAATGGPVATVMAELSIVLHALDEIGAAGAAILDSVNTAQAHFQQVSDGAHNNLLTSATDHCVRAPTPVRAGLDLIAQAQDLLGGHLVTVATAGVA